MAGPAIIGLGAVRLVSVVVTPFIGQVVVLSISAFKRIIIGDDIPVLAFVGNRTRLYSHVNMNINANVNCIGKEEVSGVFKKRWYSSGYGP